LVLVGEEVQAISQQVVDGGLKRRLGEDGRNRVREALQAIDDNTKSACRIKLCEAQ
jgi:hypothetical protein